MNNFKAILSIVALAAVTACGGGGGGGDDDKSPSKPIPEVPVTPDAVSSAGTLVNDAGASSYAAGSQLAEAFAALNTARAAAGAGVMSQNTLLDTAAAAHARYMTTNILDADGHIERIGRPDYYGATPASRIETAGYKFDIYDEVIGGAGPSMKAAECVRGLLNSVYHAVGLLMPTTNVGIGMGLDGLNVPLCVFNQATPLGGGNVQVPASGALVAYPTPGQQNVMETFEAADEVPRPPVSVLPNASVGTPVLVNLRNADYVNAKVAGKLDAVITKFEMTDAGGNLVPTGILVHSDLRGSGVKVNVDPNMHEGFAAMVPLSPLAKGVTYTVSYTATVKAGGDSISKLWSFTTNQ